MSGEDLFDILTRGNIISVEDVQRLIAEGVDVNYQRPLYPRKDTPLHVAAAKHESPLDVAKYSNNGSFATAAVKLLIEAKANPYAEDGDKKTPLHLAAAKGNVERVKVLIEAGAVFTVLKNSTGAAFTVVCDAAAALDEETLSRAAARYLITHGVKKSLVDLLSAAERVSVNASNVSATNPSAADGSRTLSARLQLIAAKALSFEKEDRVQSKEEKIDELLFNTSSADALTIALRGGAKVFTIQPVVVQAVQRMWLGLLATDPTKAGGFLYAHDPKIIYRTLRSQKTRVAIIFFWPTVIVPNVIGATILLPLTALYPPLADWLAATKKVSKIRGGIRLPYSSLYLLTTPIVKYVVASACECTLALLLTLPSTAWLADPLHGYLLLAWVTSSLAWEIRQMVVTAGTTVWTRASAYLTDRFNRIDLPAILFTLAALVSAIVLDGGNAECGKPATDLLSLNLMGCPPPSIQTSTLRAFAAFLLCLRVLRMLLVFPGLGPYILMVFRMLQDVRKFLAILVVAVLSFTAAFFNLYEPAPTVRSTPTKGWPFLGSEPTCINYMDTFSSALVRLLEASVTGDNFFECVRDSTHPISGWFWSFLFYAALGLLLLNMLIAMMAKTFDNVYEAAIPNFRYLFTQMVHSLKEQPPWPPPLYLLTLPYDCYQIVKWCQLVPARRADLYRKRKGVTENTADNEMTAKIELEKSEDELARELTEYIQNNQDDVAQEERWRTIWKKDMSAKFAKQQEQLTVMREHQQEQLTDMKSQLMDMEAHMRVHMNNQLNILNALLEHHGLPTPSQAEFEPPVASAPPPHRSHTSLDDEAAHTLSDEAATADDDGSNGEAAIPEASHGRMISTDT